MANKVKNPVRNTRAKQDIGAIQSIKYNDAAGADKMIIIEPVVVRAVGAAEAVGAGKYVKVTGATYTLDLVGRDFDAGTTYQKGDVVAEAGFIYMCREDNVSGAFDASNWIKKAPKTVGPVPIIAGSVVCTGRWHNTVTGVGFLVDDESDMRHYRVRD
jgi:hypothetical protein